MEQCCLIAAVHRYMIIHSAGTWRSRASRRRQGTLPTDRVGEDASPRSWSYLLARGDLAGRSRARAVLTGG